MKLYRQNIKALVGGILLFLTTATNAAIFEVSPPKAPQGHVILTIDACSAKFDQKMFDTLVSQGIKATVFVTGFFIERNPSAFAFLSSRPDLFQIANHGNKHLSPVISEKPPFNLVGVLNEDGLLKEINESGKSIKSTSNHVLAYRGAGAYYDKPSADIIKKNGYEIAGYSSAPDHGGTASYHQIINSFSKIKDGDVVLIHATRAGTPVSSGDIDGFLLLKEKGFSFAWWSESK